MKPVQPWVRGLWVAVATLAIFSFVAGACTLPRDGALDRSCTADTECDPPESRCRLAVCNDEGFCDVVDLPDDTVLEQEAGDCQYVTCESGAEVAEADDDPKDDVLCQTDYSCDGLDLVETAVPENAACVLDGLPGECQGGVCVPSCETDAQCDDDNPCTIDTCDIVAQECVYVALDAVTSPGEMAGDCVDLICVVGEELPIVNDADVHIDGEECTQDLCNEGTSTNPPEPLDLPCSGPNGEQVCDGAGSCVQCNSPTQCTTLLPIDTPDCESRACNAGLCQYVFQPAGHPLNPSLQTIGDCKDVVCDGAGAVAVNPATNGADIPSDGNDCTDDVCVGSMPQNNFVTVGDPCGVNGVCNASAQCVGCIAASDCGNDTDCYQWSCSSQTCQQNFESFGTPTSTQIAQNCLEQVCNGAGMAIQVPDNDPIIDGNPCTDDLCNNGTPSNPPRMINASCMGSMFCDGNGSCVECNLASQCPVTGDGLCESDQCVTKMCTLVFDPPGTPAPSSEQTAGDCQTEVCNGTGNLGAPVANPGDPFNDGIDCTADTCNGTMPENDPKPAGTMCVGGVCDGMTSCVECTLTSHCMANETCVMNQCKLNNGQMCSVAAECVSGHCVDGRCCQNACTGLCQRCDIGSAGVCSNIAAGNDPNNECSGQLDCNGAGACEVGNGTACTLDTQCGSGFCRDGFCCNNSCAADCRGCGVPGSEGSCTTFDEGTDPDMDCATTGHSCDGSGVCSCGNDIEPAGLAMCPVACTSQGGSCDSQNEVCTIDCTGNGCGNLTCPPNMACVVNCSGNNACNNSTITCPAGHSCDVSCSDTTNTCVSAAMVCSSDGTCALDCSTAGSNACDMMTVTCGGDACSATCDAAATGFTFTAGMSCGAANNGC